MGARCTDARLYTLRIKIGTRTTSAHIVELASGPQPQRQYLLQWSRFLVCFSYVSEPAKVKVKTEVVDITMETGVEHLPMSDSAAFVNDTAKKVHCIVLNLITPFDAFEISYA